MAKRPTVALNPKLVFKKEWVFDPAPEIFLDRAQLVKVNKLRNQFVKDINQVLKGRG